MIKQENIKLRRLNILWRSLYKGACRVLDALCTLHQVLLPLSDVRVVGLCFAPLSLIRLRRFAKFFPFEAPLDAVNLATR